MKPTISTIVASVSRNTSVTGSVRTLIQGLSGLYHQADTDREALAELRAELREYEDTLCSAVVANTTTLSAAPTAATAAAGGVGGAENTTNGQDGRLTTYQSE
jgi:hypothetical protein